MKGTILDFLKLVPEKPELGKELARLAAKYDFEFVLPDEVSDEELESVAGGMTVQGGETGPGTTTSTVTTGGISVDINALVQSVLRESYMETTLSLAQHASEINYYNEPKG